MVTSPQPPVNGDGRRPQLAVDQLTDDVCVIAVNCELDLATSPAMGQLLTQELDNGLALLVLDLAGCEFMDSSAVGVLIGARRHAGGTGTRLALVGLTRAVARTLDVTGLMSSFDVHPTVAVALSSLSGE